MPIERFFDPDLTNETTLGHLSHEEMHHITRVFRLKTGDHCEIINGRGGLAQVTLGEMTKKHMDYHVNSFHEERKNEHHTALILGMPKFNRLEFIVEKVAEIGCDQIILFDADRSEKSSLSDNQMDRIQLLFQAALKQSGRLFIPSLELKPNLLSCFEHDRMYYFGDVKGSKKLEGLTHQKCGFIIGPESGFSDKEHLILHEKAHSVSLSDAILRVDTAAICASFLMRHYQLTR
jgi:16S rRNA (uracil1498-N3)-methyltransferase